MPIDTTVLPEHILRLMSPEDRRRCGPAGLTAGEAAARAEERAETQLQEEIATYLRLREIEYIKTDPRKRSPLPGGWPDFTFAYRGVPCALEVKTPAGAKRDTDHEREQRRRHDAMKRNGWLVLIVTGLDQVKHLLHSIDAEEEAP